MYELLSTVFDIEDILKVKDAGATGIIIGDEFHSFGNAKSFDLNMISEAVKLCKDNGLKSYVKMNRMYIDTELEKENEYLIFLKKLNVDHIFYNDPSVYVLSKQLEMENILVYNPDTIVTNSFDANYHLSKGIYGIILSKEITKEEMISIALKCKGNVGVIVSGYLNMSYSKRKLIDSYFDFIDKQENILNAKDLYLIEQTRQGKMPVLEEEQGTMVFTDYVQESFDEVVELYTNNINMFIVDGIFLNVEMVIDTLKGYKALLDNKEFNKEDYYLKYSELELSTGYMEKKTNLVK